MTICKECKKEYRQKGSAFCKECNDTKHLFWGKEIHNQRIVKECEKLIKEYKNALYSKRV